MPIIPRAAVCSKTASSRSRHPSMDILTKFQEQSLQAIYWIEPEVVHDFIRKYPGNLSRHKKNCPVKNMGYGLFCEHCLYSIYNKTTK